MLDVDVVHRDDGTRPGDVDAHILLNDGPAALEVTILGDRASLEVEAVLVRDGGWNDERLRWRWDVRPGPRTHYGRFYEHVAALLFACERDGVDRPERLTPTTAEETAALDWYDESDCRIWGNPHTSMPGTVDVLPPMMVGWEDDSLETLKDWLETVLASGHVGRRVEKLGRSGLTERHLYLIVHSSGAPFSIYVGLAMKTTLPPAPPNLPDAVTHLWIDTGYRAGGLLRFDPTAGWSRAFPFDD